VSVKACEGLVLIASIPNDSCAKNMLAHTAFMDQMTSRLCSLYSALPKVMDPADVESVDAKWGLVIIQDTYMLFLACDSIYVDHTMMLSPICPSHRWISQKWVKLGLCSFHCMVAPSI